MTAAPRLDAHLHLWDPALGVYTWLTPDHGVLHGAFTAPQAASELEAAAVGHAVLVQAADSAVDTQAMLDVAAANGWVAGVVGWIDLERPDEARDAVERWSASPVFCGVRQLIHEDARADVLDLPAVRETLAVLARQGIPLDVPDAFPRQLGGATRAAASLDDLVVVVDHLAKPPRGSDGFEAWRLGLREIARHDNVVAKVSGLEIAGQPWGVNALRPVWETALDAFGPQRLMFGSDWPITVRTSGYQATVDVVGALIGELSPDEQADVWWRTGTRTYRLDLTG